MDSTGSIDGDSPADVPGLSDPTADGKALSPGMIDSVRGSIAGDHGQGHQQDERARSPRAILPGRRRTSLGNCPRARFTGAA